MAPRTSGRGTSPNERGITRTAQTQPDPDRGLDYGGDWDPGGTYYTYADPDGTTWLWEEGPQQWTRIAMAPGETIHVTAKAPVDPTAEAMHAAYQRHLQGPTRQFGRAGIMGGAPKILGKMVAEGVHSGAEYLPTPLQPLALPLFDQAVAFKKAEAQIIADAGKDDARAAHERGELFQMPVIVGTADPAEARAVDMIVAGVTKRVGTPARSPVRVEGFLRDITLTYRNALLAIKAEQPHATAAHHGQVAEARTLAQAEHLAAARGLTPGHIFFGNFRVGVSGPKGGQLSAEMGSPYYGFMVELKKSPKAVTPWQAQGQLIAVSNKLGFPSGGVYLRIYGENYKPDQGVYRRAMGTPGEDPPAKKPRGRARRR